MCKVLPVLPQWVRPIAVRPPRLPLDPTLHVAPVKMELARTVTASASASASASATQTQTPSVHQEAGAGTGAGVDISKVAFPAPPRHTPTSTSTTDDSDTTRLLEALQCEHGVDATTLYDTPILSGAGSAFMDPASKPKPGPGPGPDPAKLHTVPFDPRWPSGYLDACLVSVWTQAGANVTAAQAFRSPVVRLLRGTLAAVPVSVFVNVSVLNATHKGGAGAGAGAGAGTSTDDDTGAGNRPAVATPRLVQINLTPQDVAVISDNVHINVHPLAPASKPPTVKVDRLQQNRVVVNYPLPEVLKRVLVARGWTRSQDGTFQAALVPDAAQRQAKPNPRRYHDTISSNSDSDNGSDNGSDSDSNSSTFSYSDSDSDHGHGHGRSNADRGRNASSGTNKRDQDSNRRPGRVSGVFEPRKPRVANGRTFGAGAAVGTATTTATPTSTFEETADPATAFGVLDTLSAVGAGVFACARYVCMGTCVAIMALRGMLTWKTYVLEDEGTRQFTAALAALLAATAWGVTAGYTQEAAYVLVGPAMYVPAILMLLFTGAPLPFQATSAGRNLPNVDGFLSLYFGIVALGMFLSTILLSVTAGVLSPGMAALFFLGHTLAAAALCVLQAWQFENA